MGLAHYLSAKAVRLNETGLSNTGYAKPRLTDLSVSSAPLLLLEIPADYSAVKSRDPALALEWRLFTRSLFIEKFTIGYLIIDFIYLAGRQPRSFYVLSHGEYTY